MTAVIDRLAVLKTGSPSGPTTAGYKARPAVLPAESGTFFPFSSVSYLKISSFVWSFLNRNVWSSSVSLTVIPMDALTYPEGAESSSRM